MKTFDILQIMKWEKLFNKKNFNKKSMQKGNELEHLEYFLNAYKSIIGEQIEIIKISESPDFICSKENGEKIGIELTS